MYKISNINFALIAMREGVFQTSMSVDISYAYFFIVKKIYDKPMVYLVKLLFY